MGNKVVVITGASSGVGRSTALHLSRLGYRLAVCARRENLLRELEEDVQREGGEIFAASCDMTVWNEVEKFFDEILKRYKRIDVLVNNVGAGIRYTEFDSLTVDEIDLGIKVNVMSVLYGSKAVIPVMKRQKSGHIINISSILGKRTRSRLAVYTAGKHAVEGFSKALWNELKGYGIKVSILAPAMINTEWAKKAGIESVFADGKMIEPEDVARMVEVIINLPGHYNIWNMDIMALSQTIDPL